MWLGSRFLPKGGHKVAPLVGRLLDHGSPAVSIFGGSLSILLCMQINGKIWYHLIWGFEE